jgi:hypothetical protein
MGAVAEGFIAEVQPHLTPRDLLADLGRPSAGTAGRSGESLASAAHQRLDPLQLFRQQGAGHLCVVGGLGAQPVPRTETQQAAEAQIGIGGDRPLAGDDLADAGGGHADGFRQAVLTDAQGFEELLLEKFTGGDGIEVGHG